MLSENTGTKTLATRTWKGRRGNKELHTQEKKIPGSSTITQVRKTVKMQHLEKTVWYSKRHQLLMEQHSPEIELYLKQKLKRSWVFMSDVEHWNTGTTSLWENDQWRKKRKILQGNTSQAKKEEKDLFVTINISFRKAWSWPMTFLEHRNGMTKARDFTREEVKLTNNRKLHKCQK